MHDPSRANSLRLSSITIQENVVGSNNNKQPQSPFIRTVIKRLSNLVIRDDKPSVNVYPSECGYQSMSKLARESF